MESNIKKKKKEVEKPTCKDASIFIFINVLTKNKNTKNTNIVFEWIKKMFKCQLYQFLDSLKPQLD